jgi:hypothetical protein
MSTSVRTALVAVLNLFRRQEAPHHRRGREPVESQGDSRGLVSATPRETRGDVAYRRCCFLPPASRDCTACKWDKKFCRRIEHRGRSGDRGQLAAPDVRETRIPIRWLRAADKSPLRSPGIAWEELHPNQALQAVRIVTVVLKDGSACKLSLRRASVKPALGNPGLGIRGTANLSNGLDRDHGQIFDQSDFFL